MLDPDSAGSARPALARPSPPTAEPPACGDGSAVPIDAAVEVSVVIPARDEAGNVRPVLDELLETVGALGSWEIVCVDDASDDGTLEALLAFRRERCPALRVVSHERGVGQSMALLSGVRAARGRLIVTLDADGQNVPADIPAMLALARARPDGSRFCIAGHRVARRDTRSKRLQSRVANAVRQRVLGDGTPDTGCALKVMPRETWLALPAFDHMHRFLPALVRRAGGEIVVHPVGHRPRLAERSKYGLLDRLGTGLVDLVGVLWLSRRTPEVRAREIGPT